LGFLGKEIAMNTTRDRVKDRIDNLADGGKSLADRADQVAQEGREAAQNVMTTVKEKAQDVGAAASQYASQAKDKVQQWGHEVAEGARQASETASEWAGEAYHATSDALQATGKELTGIVRKYPIQSLIIGVAAGYLLGRSLRD
jgi:methyl-accepting chemotaxis protein